MGELLPSNGGAVGAPEGTGVVAGLWMTCGSGGVDTRSGVSVIEGPVAGQEDAGLSIGPLGARGVGMATGARFTNLRRQRGAVSFVSRNKPPTD